MNNPTDIEQAHRVACTLRDACIKAALNGYEDAGISGLCAEGRCEAAISAIEMLDVDALLTTEFGACRHAMDREAAP